MSEYQPLIKVEPNQPFQYSTTNLLHLAQPLQKVDIKVEIKKDYPYGFYDAYRQPLSILIYYYLLLLHLAQPLLKVDVKVDRLHYLTNLTNYTLYHYYTHLAQPLYQPFVKVEPNVVMSNVKRLIRRDLKGT